MIFGLFNYTETVSSVNTLFLSSVCLRLRVSLRVRPCSSPYVGPPTRPIAPRRLLPNLWPPATPIPTRTPGRARREPRTPRVRNQTLSFSSDPSVWRWPSCRVTLSVLWPPAVKESTHADMQTRWEQISAEPRQKLRILYQVRAVSQSFSGWGQLNHLTANTRGSFNLNIKYCIF